MSRMDTRMNDDLLVKYLLNEASAPERVKVEEWLQQSDANRKHFDQFKLILEQSQLAESTTDEYEALERLHARMKREQPPTVKIRQANRIWLSAAASLLVLGTIGWLLYSSYFGTVESVNVLAGTNILTDTLPDGSVATLNRNSSLTYPEKFRGDTRSVQLKGEAFFKVEPDKARAFVISVNKVQITVVGTSFNVKNRDGKTTVIVETGVVHVSKGTSMVKLKAGDMVDVSDAENTLVKERNINSLYNYYYSNELVCDNTPLHELVDILNEKFNARIVIRSSKLYHMPISTTFRNESLDEILDIITETLNARTERNGGEIILR